MVAAKETYTPRLCSNCAFWERGFRGDATSSYPWHLGDVGAMGDCRQGLPAAGPKNFPRTHAEDWCGKHLPIGNAPPKKGA